jgi:hypothetical protein
MGSGRKGGALQMMIMQGKTLESYLGSMPLEPPLW